MNQLDLVWPGLVVVLSVAAAIIVRLVAAQGERWARARHRRAIERAASVDEVWQGRRGAGARDAGSGESSEAPRAEPSDRGDDA